MMNTREREGIVELVAGALTCIEFIEEAVTSQREINLHKTPVQLLFSHSFKRVMSNHHWLSSSDSSTRQLHSPTTPSLVPRFSPEVQNLLQDLANNEVGLQVVEIIRRMRTHSVMETRQSYSTLVDKLCLFLVLLRIFNTHADVPIHVVFLDGSFAFLSMGNFQKSTSTSTRTYFSSRTSSTSYENPQSI